MHSNRLLGRLGSDRVLPGSSHCFSLGQDQHSSPNEQKFPLFMEMFLTSTGAQMSRIFPFP